MRWGIIPLFSLLCLGILMPVAYADGPLWALVSTEVDETLDGPLYKDRQMLQLWPPSWGWSGLACDIFFDPGTVLGVETGLDAFDIQTLGVQEYYFFSTEVDVVTTGGLVFEDEDLLQYDPSTGLVTEALDIKDIMGADYGLDAGMWWYNERETSWQFIFSTEVGGELLIDGQWVEFTGGDLLVTDGTSLTGYLDIGHLFSQEVGLDALQAYVEEEEGEFVLKFMISTEVDGVLRHDVLDEPIFFKDQDILQLNIEYFEDEPPGAFLGAELAWRGIEDGFGKDVGLDALYMAPIPEPGTVLLVGLGLGALVLRLRRKR